jgi:6-phosphofructokinase 1
MQARNAFYAQSGGVTAVINATACGLIQAARRSAVIGKVFAGQNGIVGALTESLFDTSLETEADIAALYHTPGGIFGSCRYKLLDLEHHCAHYERLMQVFAAHDIGYFFYNGGNGSMDTALQVARMAESIGYPLTCIGIPKTIDNDLLHTDCCPGFGSAAKYVATSVREIGRDVAAMSNSSTQVYVLEVMGRHAGWLAAAAGLAAEQAGDAPHLLLFPEIAFDEASFLQQVKSCVATHGYCVIVASEGICSPSGHSVARCAVGDVHSHSKPGEVGSALVTLIESQLGYKYHWALVDYLQRAAGHLVSATDQQQAHALGEAAITLALQGQHRIMPTIERLSDSPYRWQIGQASLDAVASAERKMPQDFISADGYHITDACRRYLTPLISGESWPPYRDGLPDYARLKNVLVPRQLPDYPV